MTHFTLDFSSCFSGRKQEALSALYNDRTQGKNWPENGSKIGTVIMQPKFAQNAAKMQ